jgi:uncharacterized protein (AIM24 family)
MAQYSIAEFVKTTQQRDKGEGVFELEGDRLLEIHLNGRVWTKAGAMVAYRGDIKFTREGMLEHGLGRFLKEAFTSEGLRLMKAEGVGTLYLADAGKNIFILDLQGTSLFVNGNDLLAFEDRVQWDITLMRRISSMLAGGLFNVKFAGEGLIAMTTHHKPVTLTVHPGRPVITDPNATVAWSGSLNPTLQTDISFKTFLGRGSGEALQMRFEGSGWVVIQPYEEIYLQA